MIIYKLMGKKDSDLVKGWLKKPHVAEYFYGQGLKNTLENIDLFVNGIDNNGKYRFKFWIAELNSIPFGLLMTSPVEGPYYKYYKEGQETITLDLLIGEEDFLRKGLGSVMIKELIRQKFPNASTVLIDPEASNKKAIHVYEKAGFKKVEQFTPDYNPVPHWMMIKKMQQ